MKNKHEFFKPKPEITKDRFFAQRHNLADVLDLQKGRIQGIFDNQEPSPYNDQVCQALWGRSFNQAQNQSAMNPESQRPELHRNSSQPLSSYSLKLLGTRELPKVIADEYYYNPLCWGDIIYVGLGSDLYSFNYHNGIFTEMQAGSIYGSEITALAYHPQVLARAAHTGSVRFIDTTNDTTIKKLQCNEVMNALVSDEEHGFYMLSQEYRDLSYYDLRTQGITFSLPELDFYPLGLAFNTYDKTLAVGSFSFTSLYDVRQLSQVKIKLEGHTTPAKALAFSPGNGEKLISGGGETDRTLRVWNTTTGKELAQVQTYNQICGVHWLGANIVFTNDGFNDKSVSCWSINKNKLVLQNKIKLNQQRELYSAQNPQNRNMIVTAAGGASALRFWSVEKTEAAQTSKSVVFNSVYSTLR